MCTTRNQQNGDIKVDVKTKYPVYNNNGLHLYFTNKKTKIMKR